MPYKINRQEFEAVSSLPPAERYEHFVKRVADWEEVWTLRSPDGFALADDGDGRELVPVWPHPDYAGACACGAWADYLPDMISPARFREKWLPGIERDARAVSVFPVPAGPGIVSEAPRLAADLEAALSQYD
jgi:hypothetical protein